jgi:hypothetical protein
VVGLIIESPLAHDNSSSGIFYWFNHVSEIIGLDLNHLVVVFCRWDIDVMLGFWLWRLKSTS